MKIFKKSLLTALISSMMILGFSQDTAFSKEKKDKSPKIQVKTAQNDENEIAADDSDDSKNSAVASVPADSEETGLPARNEKKPLFSLTTKSRVDETNENRMADKLFMKGSSTDKFKVYADDYYFIVLIQSPYSYKETAIKTSFNGVKNLIVTISNKNKPAEQPYLYDIKFPAWTKKEVTSKLILKDGRIELSIPRDEFNEEMDARRRNVHN